MGRLADNVTREFVGRLGRWAARCCLTLLLIFPQPLSAAWLILNVAGPSQENVETTQDEERDSQHVADWAPRGERAVVPRRSSKPVCRALHSSRFTRLRADFPRVARADQQGSGVRVRT